jgi:hypothetical protein
VGCTLLQADGSCDAYSHSARRCWYRSSCLVPPFHPAFSTEMLLEQPDCNTVNIRLAALAAQRAARSILGYVCDTHPRTQLWIAFRPSAVVAKLAIRSPAGVPSHLTPVRIAATFPFDTWRGFRPKRQAVAFLPAEAARLIEKFRARL